MEPIDQSQQGMPCLHLAVIMENRLKNHYEIQINATYDWLDYKIPTKLLCLALKPQPDYLNHKCDQHSHHASDIPEIQTPKLFTICN